jgi:hypothetical protein
MIAGENHVLVIFRDQEGHLLSNGAWLFEIQQVNLMAMRFIRIQVK